MLGKARFRSELLTLLQVTNLRCWNLSFTLSLAFSPLAGQVLRDNCSSTFLTEWCKGALLETGTLCFQGATGRKVTAGLGCHDLHPSFPLWPPLALSRTELSWGWLTIVLPAFLFSCLHHFPLSILYSFLYLTGAYFFLENYTSDTISQSFIHVMCPRSWDSARLGWRSHIWMFREHLGDSDACSFHMNFLITLRCL